MANDAANQWRTSWTLIEIKPFENCPGATNFEVEETKKTCARVSAPASSALQSKHIQNVTDCRASTLVRTVLNNFKCFPKFVGAFDDVPASVRTHLCYTKLSALTN